MLSIGIGIITYLLRLSFFPCPCCILLFFITIILYVFPIIMKNNEHLLDTLGLLGLFTIIGISTLTDLVMTPEFHMNYIHLSKIDIILFYMGTARIIIGITLTKNELFLSYKKNE